MNAPATKEVGPVAQFSGFLEKFKPQLELALPKHLNVDRMARLALTSFSTSPKLQKCEPRTIAASLMVAGQLGLEPGVNGQGWLIPYKTTCTFVPGWKGLVDLVNRSGRATVYTGVIFSDQRYTFVDGAKRDLLIHNETELDAPEDITHAYAIGWVKDASMPVIEFWPVKKIRKHRDKYNKVGSDHYSFRDWEMYCRKIPLLQVLKYMPQSIELSNAIAASYAAEEGRGVTIDGLGVLVETDGDGDDAAHGAGGSHGGARASAKAAWSDEQFKKNLPGWQSLIAKKAKTVDEVIAMAQTKGPLTAEQIATLKNNSAPGAEGSAQTSGGAGAAASNPAQSDADKLIDKIRLSTDADTLDAHADLIGTLPEEDRANVTAFYKAQRAELIGK